jgi:hypothetical protein
MLKMNLETNALSEIKAKGSNLIEDDVTWVVLELNLTKIKRHDMHSDRIKQEEEKYDKKGYKMKLYEHPVIKGIYHLHFTKKIGELEHA